MFKYYQILKIPSKDQADLHGDFFLPEATATKLWLHILFFIEVPGHNYSLLFQD